MERPAPRYVVGIDLGTTNCAVALAELERARRVGSAAVKVLEIDQLVAPGEVAPRPLLPSCLYLPGPHELPPGALDLFGDGSSQAADVVGEFARLQGARVPGRLVVSAKSWLCHGAVDRRAAILPYGAPKDVPRRSPVAVSARFLEHIRRVWDRRFPDAPLAVQDVVLTVPASFDDVARSLTLEAARLAGLEERLVLLEEPQAAFYDYFAAHQPALAADPRERLVLVVDVGGGTTDMTLIRVGWEGGEGGGPPRPVLSRLAVGDHILLGGDNMDIALARLAEVRMAGRAGVLDPARWALLVHGCRLAKEVLLAEEGKAPASFRVTVPGRGSRLVGEALSCELTREEVLAATVDGFLPRVSAAERPARRGRSGLMEFGLPFAADPAITRHLAAFLDRHRSVAQGPCDALLLNGGVFKGRALASRLCEVVASWYGHGPAGPPDLLLPESLDLAVARGAATFGLVRHGLAHRIGGGAARAYYVGIATGGNPGDRDRKGGGWGKAAAPAVPEGLCLIPRHGEAGKPVHLSDRTFTLVVGRPVRFPLYATSSDRADRPGDVVPMDPEEFIPLPPVQTVLPFEGGRAEVPVTLRAELTEVGVLEVWCVGVDRDRQWKLEFSLRGALEAQATADAGGGAAGPPVASPLLSSFSSSPSPSRALPSRALAAAGAQIDAIFGKSTSPVPASEVKRLVRNLEGALACRREGWSLKLLRELWEFLRPGVRRRRRSAEHEAAFFGLAGYLLRPGFGYPFDDWRVGELWGIFEEGIQYHKDPRVWQGWWVMWRRVAGGLEAGCQERLLAAVTPFIRPSPEAGSRPKGPRPQGLEEMIRLVPALERIPPSVKADFGEWFLRQVESGEAVARSAWALARLGARVPFYGSVHQVPEADVAEGWVRRLLALDWSRTDNAAFAAAHLARATGDRMRDLSPDLREEVAVRLRRTGAPEAWARMVQEAVPLEGGDEVRLFGEHLPEGLRLLR